MPPVEPGQHRCFVSHSYQDVAVLAACLKHRLPNGWLPFVYPSQTVTPDQAISDQLLDALRDCEGFAYLDTPVSQASFWVGFERNMAARLGKPVYAFRPHWAFSSFKLDSRPPADPIISVLFNLCIGPDIERIGQIRELVWDRYRFEIRGDKWRHLDNDVRQMFDSVEGLQQKSAAGGAALVFLSNASIATGHHDYVDAFAYRRAIKDGETPIGYTGRKFAQLNPRQTLTIWLEPPDIPLINEALDRLSGETWRAYVSLVRTSLRDPHRLVVTQADGRFDLNHMDTMLARCFWTALHADAQMAASFRSSLTRSAR